ncbi:hypothetical protein EJD97_025227 [Solanum chilense]|uniref:Enoyl reductase (ER) domain-containing protein n=1 Tax=Solanum chilense TaxID=4083 RepID=A0A6N2C8B0_SOLCI|nr:hypothetical protein EJD97_025227 [Solanum chilense]
MAMHAVQYDSYGSGSAGLKHVQVPVPTLKKDEVLVKVEATSINPFDWKIQKGMLRPLLPTKFSFYSFSFMKHWVSSNMSSNLTITKHWCRIRTWNAIDVGGEVVEVGSNVKRFKAGDKVVAMLNALNGGGLAEYAVANESLTVPRLAEVSAAEGAGLIVAGLTALQALVNHSEVKLNGTGPRKNILVTAASGGVGHYAVQLAKLGNTHVTATCGARNIDFVKSLGADEVLDYKTPEGAALKSPSGQKYDAVIHCTTGIPWSTFEPNLSSSGKVVDITPGVSAMWTFAVKKLTFSKKQLVPLLLIPKKENLELIVRLLKEGKLKTVVDSRFPLSKAEDAWSKSIDGHATGKIVVEP